MGYYIQTDDSHNKAEYLITNYGATQLASAPVWESVPDSLAIICIIDNGKFEAACYIFNPRELARFKYSSDSRPKTWLTMPKLITNHLTGYKERKIQG
jgi:hypothetical protein